MTKQYDIVNLIGNDSFTYQLYSDIAVPSTGTSEVSSVLETSMPEDVLVTFDVSGATTGILQRSTLTLSGPGTTNLFIDAFSVSPTYLTQSMVFSPPEGSIVGGDGTYKLVRITSGTEDIEVYKNDTLVGNFGSLEGLTQYFTGFTINNISGGLVISNVVLGTP